MRWAANAADASNIAPGKIVLSSYGQNPQTGIFSKSAVRHVRVGQASKAAEIVEGWKEDEHRNCFVEYSFKAEELPRGARGEETSIEGVWGLCADLDRDHGNSFSLDDLPFKPTFVVVTSSQPDENFQPVFILTHVIHPFEAKALAWGLAKLVRDEGVATKDINHPWRLPFTLNWPNRAKVERGRPRQPQEARLHPMGYGEPVDPDRLAQAIAERLDGGVIPLTLAYSTATGVNDPREQLAAKSKADVYNGNKHDLVRYEDACHFIEVNDHKTAYTVTAAIHRYTEGAPWGLEWALGVCGGNVDKGWPGCTKTPKVHDPDAIRSMWTSLGRASTWEAKEARSRRIGIGSLVRLAQRAGWDATLRSHPKATRPTKNALQAVSPSVQAVLERAAEMPKGELFHQAREAHLRFYVARTRFLQRAALLSVISGFINGEDGYAWPLIKTLADIMTRRSGKAWTSARVSEIARDLCDEGVLVMSPGNLINPKGWKGPTFALLPPAGHTWGSLVSEDRELHNNASDAGLPRTGTQENGTIDKAGPATRLAIANGVQNGSRQVHQPVFIDHQIELKEGEVGGGSESEAFQGQPEKAPEQARETKPFQIEAPVVPEGLDLIRHWLDPQNLPQDGTERLVGALQFALPFAGAIHEHQRLILSFATQTAQALLDCERGRMKGLELSMLVKKHDLQLAAGIRDKFKPKRIQTKTWAKRLQREVPQHELGLLHYLTSIHDLLSHQAVQQVKKLTLN